MYKSWVAASGGYDRGMRERRGREGRYCEKIAVFATMKELPTYRTLHVILGSSFGRREGLTTLGVSRMVEL